MLATADTLRAVERPRISGVFHFVREITSRQRVVQHRWSPREGAGKGSPRRCAPKEAAGI